MKGGEKKMNRINKAAAWAVLLILFVLSGVIVHAQDETMSTNTPGSINEEASKEAIIEEGGKSVEVLFDASRDLVNEAVQAGAANEADKNAEGNGEQEGTPAKENPQGQTGEVREEPEANAEGEAEIKPVDPADVPAEGEQADPQAKTAEGNETPTEKADAPKTEEDKKALEDSGDKKPEAVGEGNSEGGATGEPKSGDPQPAPAEDGEGKKQVDPSKDEELTKLDEQIKAAKDAKDKKKEAELQKQYNQKYLELVEAAGAEKTNSSIQNRLTDEKDIEKYNIIKDKQKELEEKSKQNKLTKKDIEEYNKLLGDFKPPRALTDEESRIKSEISRKPYINIDESKSSNYGNGQYKKYLAAKEKLKKALDPKENGLTEEDYKELQDKGIKVNNLADLEKEFLALNDEVLRLIKSTNDKEKIVPKFTNEGDTPRIDIFPYDFTGSVDIGNNLNDSDNKNTKDFYLPDGTPLKLFVQVGRDNKATKFTFTLKPNKIGKPYGGEPNPDKQVIVLNGEEIELEKNEKGEYSFETAQDFGVGQFKIDMSSMYGELHEGFTLKMEATGDGQTTTVEKNFLITKKGYDENPETGNIGNTSQDKPKKEEPDMVQDGKVSEYTEKVFDVFALLKKSNGYIDKVLVNSENGKALPLSHVKITMHLPQNYDGSFAEYIYNSGLEYKKESDGVYVLELKTEEFGNNLVEKEGKFYFKDKNNKEIELQKADVNDFKNAVLEGKDGKKTYVDDKGKVHKDVTTVEAKEDDNSQYRLIGDKLYNKADNSLIIDFAGKKIAVKDGKTYELRGDTLLIYTDTKDVYDGHVSNKKDAKDGDKFKADKLVTPTNEGKQVTVTEGDDGKESYGGTIVEEGIFDKVTKKYVGKSGSTLIGVEEQVIDSDGKKSNVAKPTDQSKIKEEKDGDKVLYKYFQDENGNVYHIVTNAVFNGEYIVDGLEYKKDIVLLDKFGNQMKDITVTKDNKGNYTFIKTKADKTTEEATTEIKDGICSGKSENRTIKVDGEDRQIFVNEKNYIITKDKVSAYSPIIGKYYYDDINNKFVSLEDKKDQIIGDKYYLDLVKAKLRNKTIETYKTEDNKNLDVPEGARRYFGSEKVEDYYKTKSNEKFYAKQTFGKGEDEVSIFVSDDEILAEDSITKIVQIYTEDGKKVKKIVDKKDIFEEVNKAKFGLKFPGFLTGENIVYNLKTDVVAAYKRVNSKGETEEVSIYKKDGNHENANTSRTINKYFYFENKVNKDFNFFKERPKDLEKVLDYSFFNIFYRDGSDRLRDAYVKDLLEKYKAGEYTDEAIKKVTDEKEKIKRIEERDFLNLLKAELKKFDESAVFKMEDDNLKIVYTKDGKTVEVDRTLLWKVGFKSSGKLFPEDTDAEITIEDHNMDNRLIYDEIIINDTKENWEKARDERDKVAKAEKDLAAAEKVLAAAENVATAAKQELAAAEKAAAEAKAAVEAAKKVADDAGQAKAEADAAKAAADKKLNDALVKAGQAQDAATAAKEAVEKAQENLETAKENAKKAEADAQAAADVAKEKADEKAEADTKAKDAEAKLEEAKDALTAAEQALEEAKAKAAEEDTPENQAAVEAAKAKVEEAQAKVTEAQAAKEEADTTAQEAADSQKAADEAAQEAADAETAAKAKVTEAEANETAAKANQAKAEDAKKVAEQAALDADAEKAKADEAAQKADEAKTAADQAKAEADDEKAKADEAKTKAEAAKAAADTNLKTVEEAQKPKIEEAQKALEAAKKSLEEAQKAYDEAKNKYEADPNDTNKEALKSAKEALDNLTFKGTDEYFFLNQLKRIFLGVNPYYVDQGFIPAGKGFIIKREDIEAALEGDGKITLGSGDNQVTVTVTKDPITAQIRIKVLNAFHKSHKPTEEAKNNFESPVQRAYHESLNNVEEKVKKLDISDVKKFKDGFDGILKETYGNSTDCYKTLKHKFDKMMKAIEEDNNITDKTDEIKKITEKMLDEMAKQKLEYLDKDKGEYKYDDMRFNALRFELAPGQSIGGPIDDAKKKYIGISSVLVPEVDIPFTDEFGNPLTNKDKYVQEAIQKIIEDKTFNGKEDKTFKFFDDESGKPIWNKSEDSFIKVMKEAYARVKKLEKEYAEKHKDEKTEDKKNLIKTLVTVEDGKEKFGVQKYTVKSGKDFEYEDFAIEGENGKESLKDNSGNPVNPYWIGDGEDKKTIEKNIEELIKKYKLSAEQIEQYKNSEAYKKLIDPKLEIGAYYMHTKGYDRATFANSANYKLNKVHQGPGVFGDESHWKNKVCYPGIIGKCLEEAGGDQFPDEDGENAKDQSKGKIDNKFTITYPSTGYKPDSEENKFTKEGTPLVELSGPESKAEVNYTVELNINKVKSDQKISAGATKPAEKAEADADNYNERGYFVYKNSIIIDFLPEIFKFKTGSVMKLEINEGALRANGANKDLDMKKFKEDAKPIYVEDVYKYLETLDKTKAQYKALKAAIEVAEEQGKIDKKANKHAVLAWLNDFEAPYGSDKPQFTLTLKDLEVDKKQFKEYEENKGKGEVFTNHAVFDIHYANAPTTVKDKPKGTVDKTMRIYDEDGKIVNKNTKKEWFRGYVELKFGDQYDYKIKYKYEKGFNTSTTAGGMDKKAFIIDMFGKKEFNKGLRPVLRELIDFEGKYEGYVAEYTLDDEGKEFFTREQIEDRIAKGEITIGDIVGVKISHNVGFEIGGDVEFILPMMIPNLDAKVENGQVYYIGQDGERVELGKAEDFFDLGKLKESNEKSEMYAINEVEKSNTVTVYLEKERFIRVFKEFLESDGKTEIKKDRPEVKFEIKQIEKDKNGKVVKEVTVVDKDGNPVQLVVNEKNNFTDMVDHLPIFKKITTFDEDGKATVNKVSYEYKLVEKNADGYDVEYKLLDDGKDQLGFVWKATNTEKPEEPEEPEEDEPKEPEEPEEDEPKEPEEPEEDEPKEPEEPEEDEPGKPDEPETPEEPEDQGGGRNTIPKTGVRTDLGSIFFSGILLLALFFFKRKFFKN